MPRALSRTPPQGQGKLAGLGAQGPVGVRAPDSGGQAGHMALAGASRPSGLGSSGQF